MRDGAAAADVLHWGWLASGVSSVVLSRWMTPAAATERLMTTFYEQLQRGVALPEALREAQLAVRGVADTVAPVNWAGWMLVGR
jgi:CHAT domain-containing protein